MPAIRSKRTLGALAVSSVAWFVYLFLMLPILIVIPMSFGSKNELAFPPTGFSTHLYERLVFEPSWMNSIFMSFRVAISAMILSLLMGVPAAYCIVRGRFPGRQVLVMFLLSPILVPIIVIALGLYFYFAKLGSLGSEFGLIIAHTVYVMPFVIVTSMVGLRHIDQNLEAAATVMGAGSLMTFQKVTLPLLRPAMLAGGLFAFLMSFDEVVIAYFITKSDRTTLPVKMLTSVMWEISPVLAAVSSALTLLSLAVCLVGVSLQRKS